MMLRFALQVVLTIEILTWVSHAYPTSQRMTVELNAKTTTQVVQNAYVNVSSVTVVASSQSDTNSASKTKVEAFSNQTALNGPNSILIKATFASAVENTTLASFLTPNVEVNSTKASGNTKKDSSYTETKHIAMSTSNPGDLSKPNYNMVAAISISNKTSAVDFNMTLFVDSVYNNQSTPDYTSVVSAVKTTLISAASVMTPSEPLTTHSNQVTTKATTSTTNIAPIVIGTDLTHFTMINDHLKANRFPGVRLQRVDKPFKCPQADGLFADSKHCGSFWHCNSFIAYQKQCPGNLVFNPEISVCDYTSPSCKTNRIRRNPRGFECHTDGFYPNKNDCHMFYRCSNGLVFEQKCPGDFFYNQVTQTCENSPVVCIMS